MARALLTPLILATAAVAACTGIQQTRIYAGPQTPIAGTCDRPSRATLTRRGPAIILAPSQGTLTLDGTTDGRTLSAQTTLTGADKRTYPLVFTGQFVGTDITGTLVTPLCRYALALKLTDD